MRSIHCTVTALALSIAMAMSLHAAPYASNISVSGTTVNFTLNQTADFLSYSINGGSPVVMADPSKGSKSFNLNSPSDTFSIIAELTSFSGFTIPTGGTVNPTANAISQTATEVGWSVISDSTNPLTKFNSPRGISVSNDPKAPNFGTTYISNSAASTGTVGGIRTSVGKGMYALLADQSDAYGYGDTAQQSTFFSTPTPPSTAVSANTPYKVFVAADGNVYVSGFADGVSGVFQLNPDMTTLTNVLAGTGGPATLPLGQNHGSVLSSYVSGSTTGGNLVVYTVDEDLTTNQVTGAGSTTDFTSIWKYDIGGAALPYSGMPTKFSNPFINVAGVVGDIQVGPDGKMYASQFRAQPATASGIFVMDPNGAILYNSLADSRARFNALGDYNGNDVVDTADYVVWRKNKGLMSGATTAQGDGDGDGDVDDDDYTYWRSRFGNVTEDYFRGSQAMTVSPDGTKLAVLHNNNVISIIPLVNGLPDLDNRMAFSTLPATVSGRDIAFDAAGNLHYVSSGQGVYAILEPGGHSIATTAWNGSAFTFNITNTPPPGIGSGAVIPEPGTVALALSGLVVAFGGRRRA